MAETAVRERFSAEVDRLLQARPRGERSMGWLSRETGIKYHRLYRVANPDVLQKAEPTGEEIAQVARALGVAVGDLTAEATGAEGGAVGRGGVPE